MSQTEEQKKEYADVIIGKFIYGKQSEDKQVATARVLRRLLPLATKEQMQDIVDTVKGSKAGTEGISSELVRGFSECRVAWASSFVEQLVLQSNSESLADAGIDALLFMMRYRPKEGVAAIKAIVSSKLYDFTHEVTRVHRAIPFVFIDELLSRMKAPDVPAAKRDVYLRVLCRLSWENDSVFLSETKPMLEELARAGRDWKVSEMIEAIFKEGMGTPCGTTSSYMLDILDKADLGKPLPLLESGILARMVMYSDRAVSIMEKNLHSCKQAMYLLSANIKKRKHFSTRLHDIKRICAFAVFSDDPELVDNGLRLAYQLDMKDNASLEVTCRNRALDPGDEQYTSYLKIMSKNGMPDSLASVASEVPEELTSFYMDLLSKAYDVHEFVNG